MSDKMVVGHGRGASGESNPGTYVATVDRAIDLQAVTIRVWRFEDAPDYYSGLSEHGGDEDWVVHVPRKLVGEFIPFLDECVPGSIGCCRVSEHDVPGGGKVYIGAHA